MLEYAELHCLSNFTFLRGASHPEELVKRAQELGYRALALTDECSLAGVVRAHVAAQEHHLSLIIGSEFSLANGSARRQPARLSLTDPPGDSGTIHYPQRTVPTCDR